jgi:hypothetical protein
MPNPIQLIPAKVRLWLYIAYGIAGLVATSVSTYIVATGGDVPPWTVGVGAVLAGPLAVAFGFVAASNTTQANTAVVTAPDDVAITPSYEGEHRLDGGRISILAALASALLVAAVVSLTLGAQPVVIFALFVVGLVVAWFAWYQHVRAAATFQTAVFREPVTAETLTRLVGNPLKD